MSLREITDAATLATYASDFGRIIQRSPHAVVRPESIDDVVALVKRARAEGRAVSLRGSAHSQSGQGLSDGGYLVDMTGLSRIEPIDPLSGVVRCQAGVVWNDLLTALSVHQLTPPVLTNNLGVTVGGTLSMAGLGVASFRDGAQVDNVRALTVVLASGEVVRCGVDENRELFDLVRCGLGQFGIIVEAELVVRTHRPFVRTQYLLYDNLAVLCRDLEVLMRENRFTNIESWAVPATQGFRHTPLGRRPFARWFFPLHAMQEVDSDSDAGDDARLAGLSPYERVHVETVPYADFARRLEPLFALWRQIGYWDNAHPWMETVLPWPATVPYITSLLAQLSPVALGGGHVLLWPGRTATSTAPNFMAPPTEFVMGFGLLPGTPQAALPQALAMLDQASDLSIAAGGKRYLSGRINFDLPRWRAHFGDRWPVLCAAKKTYDPDGLLNPGFIVWE